MSYLLHMPASVANCIVVHINGYQGRSIVSYEFELVKVYDECLSSLDTSVGRSYVRCDR